ncbi:hypothetical protein RND71_036548 [Anisodus tanguticus]|uniref:DUF538 family protein n=1 Tax=Anisodus tanguticus TaxID=243964 RepID=A0AAE1R0Q8_9SOLA|nr:hypothetical protein RND71_036548 [Anisodus tanguticus]
MASSAANIASPDSSFSTPDVTNNQPQAQLDNDEKISSHTNDITSYKVHILYSQISNTANQPKQKMAKTFIFFTIIIPLLFTISLSDPNPNPNPTQSEAHNELIKFGFPIGLLPKNVNNYALNTTSGHFVVSLTDTCRITLPPDNYLATYSKKITGKIVENKIAELNGISVRAFFKWWGITGIRSSGDNLVFEVGMVSAKYPSNNFNESPDCEGKKHSSS